MIHLKEEKNCVSNVHQCALSHSAIFHSAVRIIGVSVVANLSTRSVKAFASPRDFDCHSQAKILE